MRAGGLTDAEALERYRAYVQNDRSYRHAAIALGLGKNGDKTVKRGVEVAQRRGLHLSDGVRATLERSGVSPTEARGGWIHNYDEDGKKRGTTWWKAPDLATEDQLERIRAAFSDIPPAPAIIKPDHVQESSVAFFPHSDWHLGSVVSAERAGRDYNPKIAVEILRDGFAQCHAAIESSKTAIILNNGDLLHANDDTDATPGHKHRLKVEGTHEDNLLIAVHSTIWMIDTALERHERVIYVANPGNHDPSVPGPLRIALGMRYRDEPRVTIEQRQRHMWTWQEGRLFLSADHGDTRKPKDIAADIPTRFPEKFGKARHWYLFTGHVHTPEQNTFGGIMHKCLPALCRVDTYADDRGHTDRSAMTAMRFDLQGGLKNEHTVNL
ncbi:hypothetical protein [Pseudohoeflea coraliihabitans]|uniref:Calcineurin-like phosphoesterase domain-containing protein n=1 Tax=Pseudohoeflea coraliihabitans TaxID=2860393 RepID=A0ABS6WTI9_9HYPH|nr:hypothetical protein [Pseudohoeflea sp. DP4N28-3]MBW3099278.1 hypothetical protein [Pseudohoeflea sp. DP4N28-3]